MSIILFMVVALFGLSTFLITNKRSNKTIIYKKINDKDVSQDSHESKKIKTKKENNLSCFIKLPYIIHNIIYLRMLLFMILFTISCILIATDFIATNSVTLLYFCFIILIVVIYFPRVIIRNIVSKKIRTLLQSLPFFIDITAACVQSGMTIDSSLSYTAKKFKLINADLSLIMLKITKRAEINGLENAIKEFQQYSTETEIKMFCSALQYSIIFGSTVYDQLIKLSQDMREMQLLVTEEKNSKLSSKLTLPLFVFILIPFVALVISPSILELLKYVQTI
ncbi:putative tight adherance operon protein [Yersinia aldovae]|uniref:type II secretion system F family protein n=1 Tax=Yersinia aldovae TaxID=29483 RepID=UPI0005E3C1E4|nr:type II secretion system F family protein [Yersinia aldovae]CNJ77784.1 putative tight adherance operon protein [Yersinia aldovae]